MEGGVEKEEGGMKAPEIRAVGSTSVVTNRLDTAEQRGKDEEREKKKKTKKNDFVLLMSWMARGTIQHYYYGVHTIYLQFYLTKVTTLRSTCTTHHHELQIDLNRTNQLN